MPQSKLGRKRDARKQVVKNLATSLVLYSQIKTTDAKAKIVQPYIERIFTIAKKDTLASRRHVSELLFDKKAVAKIFEIGLPNLKDISSGFTSIIKVKPRLGDSAPQSVITINKNIFSIPETKLKAVDTTKESKTPKPVVKKSKVVK